MYKFILFAAWFICLGVGIRAQNAQLFGEVYSNSGEALPFATVQLKQATDSTLVKVESTDEQGQFRFLALFPGKYFVVVSMVGYATITTPLLSLADQQVQQYPRLTLKPSSTDLQGVTVSARKPLIEVKSDKTIFNVEGSVNAIGNNVLELLQKSPGVMVDNDGNIMLKGKSGVLLYIDGRQSMLSGNDLKELLRSLQSTEIEAIEIIAQPSARYDAAGNAGIINIRLKKDKRLGTNGNLNLGYAVGIFNKWNAGLGFNHRNTSSNWFGTYSGRWALEQNFLNLFRDQGGTRYNQRSVGRSDNASHNLKVGADWFLNPKQTLGFVINSNDNANDNLNVSRTPILAPNSTLPQRILVASNTSTSARQNLNANLNYRYADTSGRELNLDADLGLFKRKNYSIQPNNYYDATEKSILASRTFEMDTPTDIGIYTLKGDYLQKLGKGKLGLGFKTSLVDTRNSFNFYDVPEDQPVLNTQRSNQFNYRENINAAYTTYQRQWSKWSLTAGLRLEHTHSRGNLESAQENENDLVVRDYINLFPSAGISHQLNPKNSLALNYSRRIDRPSYQSLNPFVSQLDELTYGKGNPFLRPQYTNNLELSHTYNYTLTTSLRVSRTTDFFGELSDTIEGNRNFIMTSNLATEDVVSLNISYPFSLRKWWNGYVNLNAYHNRYSANFGEGRFINLDANVLSLYAQQTFTLWKKWRIEASTFYTSPSIWRGTYATRRFWGTDLGIQTRLWKERANLKLTLSDVFYSMQWQGISRFSGMTIDASGGWESRQVRMNLSYNFGNQQVKGARKRSTGLEEESNRTN